MLEEKPKASYIPYNNYYYLLSFGECSQFTVYCSSYCVPLPFSLLLSSSPALVPRIFFTGSLAHTLLSLSLCLLFSLSLSLLIASLFFLSPTNCLSLSHVHALTKEQPHGNDENKTKLSYWHSENSRSQIKFIAQ